VACTALHCPVATSNQQRCRCNWDVAESLLGTTMHWHVVQWNCSGVPATAKVWRQCCQRRLLSSKHDLKLAES
jgi:hypothetical protein